MVPGGGLSPRRGEPRWNHRAFRWFRDVGTGPSYGIPRRTTGVVSVNPPAIVVRLPLEGAPVVYVDTLSEAEAVRLDDWLETRPEYAGLVDDAMRLAEEARAA